MLNEYDQQYYCGVDNEPWPCKVNQLITLAKGQALQNWQLGNALGAMVERGQKEEGRSES
jgi:hypothetical protein